MDLLDQLATYLAGLHLGTYGDADPTKNDIFVAKHPADPDNCTSILGQLGRAIGVQRDVPELQLPMFQVIIRNTNYDAASAQLQAVRTALHGKLQLILPTTANTATDDYIRIMRCHADQEGGPIGTDDQGRFEFSINFDIEYHVVTQ